VSAAASDATRELEARLERLETRVEQLAALLEELTGEQLTGA
jgi:archaellum component FlaC